MNNFLGKKKKRTIRRPGLSNADVSTYQIVWLEGGVPALWHKPSDGKMNCMATGNLKYLNK